jgi:trehalose 6-phosphate phosphatase
MGQAAVAIRLVFAGLGGGVCAGLPLADTVIEGGQRDVKQRIAELRLEDLDEWCLFLDLDGTLVEVAATPDGIAVPPDLAPLLGRVVTALDGAVGMISGRRISDIDRLLAPLKLIAAGVHGAELRTAVDSEIQYAAKPLAAGVVEALSALTRLLPGIVVEPKGTSLTVHYRAAPSAGPVIEAVLDAAIRLGGLDLILCPGRKVFEVVPAHIAKGTALERLAQLPEFRSRRPIMIGDDVSDESALEAASRLGGLGLKVAGEHFPKETADFEGPAHVRAWLRDVAERVET